VAAWDDNKFEYWFIIRGNAAIAPAIATPELSYDFTALSALKTVYVGNNSAVSRIAKTLPAPTNNWRQRFISIGDDYDSRLATNTLTVYYEPIDLNPDEEIRPYLMTNIDF